MKGQFGRPACDGDQVIGRHMYRQSRDHRMSNGRPFRRARKGTLARTCLMIPRRRVMDSFSKIFFFYTTSELAAI